MATYTKEILSGSTDGVGITIASVSGGTAGTAGTIHQAPAGTAGKDEVYLYAYNGHTADVVLTVEWGTSAYPRKVTIPFQAGLICVTPGLPIRNSLAVQAFASVTNVITLDGFVNRITD